MAEYWAIHTSGFLDMRGAAGPFGELETARAKCLSLPTFKRNAIRNPTPVRIGDWFAIHRDSPDDGKDMTMVDGPYSAQEEAESERQVNINDPQSFDCDCNGHKGFVATVVAILPNHRAIVERK